LDFDKLIQDGNFKEIKKWLNDNIHFHGSFYDIDELLIKLSNEGLNEKYLLDYLNQKYSKIYNL
jgi:carboxypeptidase Taq